MSDVQPLFYSKVLSIKQILVFLQVNASVFQIMVNSKRPIIITLLLLLLVLHRENKRNFILVILIHFVIGDMLKIM